MLSTGAATGAERNKKREKMFFCGMIFKRKRRVRAMTDQTFNVNTLQGFIDPIRKPCHPIGFRRVHGVPESEKFRKIVRERAGADDQHALRTQSIQGSADLHMMRRPQMGLQRNLQNRNVRRRRHERERNPRPMVEAAKGINL